MLLAVSYRDVHHGRPWGAKLSEQRSLLLHGGRPQPRGHGRDSQHLGGWEPGSCGTVNTREALVNAVSDAKRKMLTRLDQKTVSGQVRRLRTPPAQPTHHRRRGAT